MERGKESQTRVIIRDDYFGEVGLFVNKHYSYSVTAMTHVDVFRLSRSGFEEAMRDHPSAAVHIADVLGNILPTAAAKVRAR